MIDNAMLELTDVGYSWPGGTESLGPLSASIPRGRWVAVIGPNGAGKSTLLRLIGAFWKPSHGTIHVAGQNVANITAPRRAQLMAFVPQSLETSFDLTVREVVELGALNQLSWRDRMPLHEQPSPKAQQIMAETAVAPLQDRSFATLSGGEVKRTLLAAALVQEASLLLLDEPTAHLDPGHAMKFLNLVHAKVAQEGLTVLMAYHDLTTVSLYADIIWVMHEGQLVLNGSPEAVLGDPRLCQIYQTNLLQIPHPRTRDPLLLFP